MTEILLDTSFLIAILNRNSVHYKNSIAYMTVMIENNINGIVNSYVLNELHYYYIRSYDKKEALIALNSVVRNDSIIYRDVEFSIKDILKISNISINYNLKTFDAYHVHFCEKIGIKKIATYDEDFKRVKSIEVVG